MAINDKILQIWEEEQPSDLVPQFYDENLNKNALLFIGLNPSFSKKGFERFLKETEYKHIKDFENYFSYNNFLQNPTQRDEFIRNFINIEEISKNSYPFYLTQRRIAEELKLPYEHIDLFFKRDTNQQNIAEEYRNNVQITNKANRII